MTRVQHIGGLQLRTVKEPIGKPQVMVVNGPSSPEACMVTQLVPAQELRPRVLSE